MEAASNKHPKNILLQHDVNATDEDSTMLLRETLSPFYGPELPHPAEHLLLDENNELLDRHIARLLASYSVDINHGFLSSDDPLRQLPLSSKFGCWELLMMDLSQYLHAKNIRSIVLSQLKVIHIEQDDLLDEREFQRAEFVLAVLSSAFIFGEEPISTYIPSCLAIPWVELTRRACRVPIITHSLIILKNWRRFDIEKPIELGNIGMLNGFLSGTDEANFYLVTVELESHGGKAVKHMLRAQYFVSKGQIKELIEELKQLETVQESILTSLSKMFQEVDPYIFFTRVRHFLAGWKGNLLLPDGMLYEGVTETPQFLHGPSAGQSSLIAAFDVFFDVKHNSEHTREFISEMRFYMPPKHRQFLDMLGTPSYNISSYMKELNLLKHEGQTNELISAYNACIDQLLEFRNKHLQIVTLYVVAQMSKNNDGAELKDNNEINQTGNNNDKDEVVSESSVRGTAGTILMPFLKTCRDETEMQRLT